LQVFLSRLQSPQSTEGKHDVIKLRRRREEEEEEEEEESYSD